MSPCAQSSLCGKFSHFSTDYGLWTEKSHCNSTAYPRSPHRSVRYEEWWLGLRRAQFLISSELFTVFGVPPTPRQWHLSRAPLFPCWGTCEGREMWPGEKDGPLWASAQPHYAVCTATHHPCVNGKTFHAQGTGQWASVLGGLLLWGGNVILKPDAF